MYVIKADNHQPTTGTPVWCVVCTHPVEKPAVKLTNPYNIKVIFHKALLVTRASTIPWLTV